MLVLNQAGWHGSRTLVVPPAITLVPLPLYAPELNQVERAWLHLRERQLSHRLLDGYDAIVHACCEAWNAMHIVLKLGREAVQKACMAPVETSGSTTALTTSLTPFPPRLRWQPEAMPPVLLPLPAQPREFHGRHIRTATF